MYKNKTVLLCIHILLLQTSSIHSMTEMAIMLGSQQGASIACESISSMYQDMATAVLTNQTTIQNSLQSFSSVLSQANAKNAQLLNKIFTNSLTHASNAQKSQSGYAQQMQKYIDKAISLHKPPTYYILSNAAIFDQAFNNGTMFTPEGPLWKNIFAYGDWEYDETSNSFIQYIKVPLYTVDQTTKKPSSSKASYNNIFAEYITNARSYEIQCEITIYHLEYPFFVGIQFNKTRWISGNADSLTVCRLLGIYGSSNTSINTYYAEQPPTSFFTTNKNPDKKYLLTPLDQIIQQETSKQSSNTPALFQNLNNTPVTFVIKIATAPEKVQFKIWQKNSNEPSTFTTIKNTIPDLYQYHNIGFISPGAIAQFRLIKPTDLLFSQDAQTNFSQEIKNLLDSQ